MHPERTRRARERGCLRWLTAGKVGARCVRFERRARLPALEIAVDTLDEAWATSWPGVLVDFDAGRALVITVDYEELRCDLQPSGQTPYR